MKRPYFNEVVHVYDATFFVPFSISSAKWTFLTVT